MNLPRRRITAERLAVRQVRITYRCLTIDLHEEMPARDVDLATLDLPILQKARDLAPAYPAGQVRIQEIADTMVFRFTHGRYRVATWLDSDADIVWVCAADERDEETYEFFVDLHRHDELLPTEDDHLRLEVEAATRFVHTVNDGVPRWLDEARSSPAREHDFELPGGVRIRLFVRRDDVEEVWLAMPTLRAPSGLTPNMRAVLLEVVKSHLEDAEWEQRYDWPTGDLMNYEIVHLGLR